MVRAPLFLVLLSCMAAAADKVKSPEKPDQLLAIVTAQAGDIARVDAAVSVDLPPEISAFRPMRLLEITGEERSAPVPAQVEPGNPRRLWFVLSGTTPAGAARKFELRRGEPVEGGPLSFRLGPATLDLSFGEAPLFTYNHAHVVPPKGASRVFIRSGYIHPMFSPSGMLITEDMPADHLHHKGVWFPWTSTEFEGRHIDFWNLGDQTGTVQFAGFDAFENGPVYGKFGVKHEHLDITQPNGGTVVLNETWGVRVWTAGGRERGFWIWDIASAQTCVAKNPLHLNAYRYGGIGYRGPKEWKDAAYKVLSSEGHTKENGHTKTSRWCAHSGAIGGKWATVVVMSHPSNLRHPEPMRIWDTGGCFFNYCPVQKEPMDMKPGETYAFKYRFYIHEGEIDAPRAEAAWREFARPATATLQVVKSGQ